MYANAMKPRFSQQEERNKLGSISKTAITLLRNNEDTPYIVSRPEFTMEQQEILMKFLTRRQNVHIINKIKLHYRFTGNYNE